MEGKNSILSIKLSLLDLVKDLEALHSNDNLWFQLTLSPLLYTKRN